ncbi:unnamed protein product [Linum trigynum]|uniref:Uncharacterized protein n=1 Tax=Linum trigynum TaxID=586398 RepID=A0AAV2GKU7_9ROSI
MTKTDSEMVEDPPPELGSIGKRMEIGVPVNRQSVLQAEGQIARCLDIMRGDLYSDNGKDMKTMEATGWPLDRRTGSIPSHKDDSEEDTKKPSSGVESKEKEAALKMAVSFAASSSGGEAKSGADQVEEFPTEMEAEKDSSESYLEKPVAGGAFRRRSNTPARRRCSANAESKWGGGVLTNPRFPALGQAVHRHGRSGQSNVWASESDGPALGSTKGASCGLSL